MPYQRLIARIGIVASGLVVALLLGHGLSVISRPLSPNAVGRELLASDEPENAMYVFEDPKWQGVALYRAGRFNRAIGAFSNSRDIDSLYNIGNAYARLGRYDEAVQVFRDVISEEPEHEDARFNLDLVRRAAALERNRDQSGNDGLANQDNENQNAERIEEDPAELDERDDIIQTVSNEPTDAAGKEEREDQVADDGKGESTSADDGATPGGRAGTPGESIDEPKAPNSAAALADNDDQDAAELPADALTQQRRKENDQSEDAIAEEILLRRIKDQPRVVLRARLHMAFKRSAEVAEQ